MRDLRFKLTNLIRWVPAAAILIGTVGCEKPLARQEAPSKSTAKEAAEIREPAVAGLFYPKQEAELNRTLVELLDSAEAPSIDDLRGLVCPHAGYSYSGATAAAAYRTATGREFRTVILLGPSHYAGFEGISVPRSNAYRTPLGLVKVSDKAKTLAQARPFMLEPRCAVQRPSWWQQASKTAPKAGEDTPDTWEHSLEVQVPFLQKVLKDFTILPAVCGEVDPALAARALSSQIDDTTLVIASSDLSHYHPYDEAKGLDTACVKAICALDIEAMSKQEACGKTPILALMHLAHQKNWKARLLDYRNSGDVSGDKTRVVGYTAIAFYAPTKQAFSAEDRKALLDLARKSLREGVVNAKAFEPDKASLPRKFTEPKGCFVTLTKRGLLRGCIGQIMPVEPLYRAVVQNAQNSALRDPRFSAVRPDELSQIEIEISVLTEPTPLSFSSPNDLVAKLQPHRDGVVLRLGNSRSATYLPQVWAQVPNKVEFLNSLAQKAGGEAGDWRKPDTTVLIYHAEAFKESDL